jgi:isopenicillin N synthase-like dioxygenase
VLKNKKKSTFKKYMSLPKISLANLTPEIVHSQPNLPRVEEAAKQLTEACVSMGFFYICDYEHLLPEQLYKSLDDSARIFFNLPEATKMRIDMNKGGSAWRGYFPVGGELTSGVVDLKEGIYFGTEITTNYLEIPVTQEEGADATTDLEYKKQQRQQEENIKNKKVKRVPLPPLHGKNQFPDDTVPELRPAVLDYMNSCEKIGHTLMGLIAIGLQLPSSNYFYKELTGPKPLELFRIFHYPSRNKTEGNPAFANATQGVQQHTDYGLVTILASSDITGLQVLSLDDKDKWIDVQHIDGTMVINIGDMLEALTNGYFRSTPHRVLQPQRPETMRVSFPYFFDPGFDKILRPLPLNAEILKRAADACDKREQMGYKRWDANGSTLKLVNNNNTEIRYGDYVLSKVAKCFPQLFKDVVVSKL